MPSPPGKTNTKREVEKKDEVGEGSKLERVKTEVCLLEEGKNKGEEQWIDVWEEGIKEGASVRDFQVETGIRRDSKEEFKAKEIKSLLETFQTSRLVGCFRTRHRNMEESPFKRQQNGR